MLPIFVHYAQEPEAPTTRNINAQREMFVAASEALLLITSKGVISETREKSW